MKLRPLRLQSTISSELWKVMHKLNMAMLSLGLLLRGELPIQKALPSQASSLEEAIYGRTSFRHVMLVARGTRWVVSPSIFVSGEWDQ